MNCCDNPELAKQVACNTQDINTLWDTVYGTKATQFIFTGNTGVPYFKDAADYPSKYAIDIQDYTRGSALINSMDPTGIFLLGNVDYDNIHIPYLDDDSGLFVTDVDYNQPRQENKILSGFSGALAKKKLYPVMGDLDYWPATGWAFDPEGDITAKMNRTYLRMFSYLPDAKRYYSIYDEKSSTEFFVLSSGRYTDYYNRHASGFIYPTDSAFDGPQYLWFSQRASSSPAKNKVVIFHHPFTTPVNVYKGEDDILGEHVFDDFRYWDFASFGIRLIINGHSGSAYHLTKGPLHIVNSSAFARTRLGLINQGVSDTTPSTPGVIGDQGWVVNYFSYSPVGVEVPGTQIPDFGNPYDYYLVPKTQFLKLSCSKDGLVGEFISYNSQLTDFAEVVNSMNIEYTFEVSSI